MARKYEFKPDKPQISLADRLYLTKKQRKQLLKWSLYALVLLFLSVVQDVLLSRVRLFGATTELVPVGIVMICLLEGLETGSVFALVSACLYQFSGTPGGTYSIVFITFYCVLVTLLRQAYLQKGFLPALLCTAVAMILYEGSVFAIGLFLGKTTPDRVLGFAVTAGLSLAVAPVLYPVTLSIGKIGGEVWKE
ncbi:MAG: hypothetical protein IJB02_01665 [Oscillospiraceae bacterium]|nr:hypothetical protein [Oscillospiraceae bacterium]